MSSPIRGFTEKEYIKSFNKDHGTKYKTFEELARDSNYNYYEFNAFQHAYASASAEYYFGMGTANTLGYGKEAWQVLTDEPSWNLGDTNKDLQNNDVGRAMAEFAKQNGISLGDLRDRIYHRTKSNPEYYNPKGLWNNAPDNFRNYMVVPGRGGDWAIGGYRPDTWGYAGARHIRDDYKEKLDKAFETFDVKGEIIKGGGGGSPYEAHSNGETPSMAEDRLKHNPQATGTHDNPSNESQHEAYEKQRFGQPSAQEEIDSEILNTLFQGAMGAFGSSSPASEVTPSNMTLQGKVNFYDSVTTQVNYDPTKRVVLPDGSTLRYGVPVTGNDVGGGSKTPITSQPFNQKEPFSTPNSQSIKQALYSGVSQGYQYMKGFLFNRGLEVAFGKKTGKKIGEYSGWAKTIFPNQWQAASKFIDKAIFTAGKAIVEGVIVGAKVIAASAVAVAHAVAAAAVAVGTAVVAAASATAAWVAGAIAFLFAW